jgi:hypothetical protein
MTIDHILRRMTDTPDPIQGSVFEKQIDTDIVSFDAFIKTVYKDVKGTTENETGHLLVLYYGTRNEEWSHVGTFNFEKSMGYFGGSRIGSQNPWRKEGEPLVRNPFDCVL